MGKFATYLKRGSSRVSFALPPPLVGDWTLTSPLVATIRFTKVAAFPPGAFQWAGRLRATVGGTWAMTALQAGPTVDVGGTTGINYTGQFAWFDSAGRQISEWSDAKTVTAM